MKWVCSRLGIIIKIYKTYKKGLFHTGPLDAPGKKITTRDSTVASITCLDLCPVTLDWWPN